LEYLFLYENEYLFFSKIRRIAIHWGKSNIFQKKPFILYIFFFLKKIKPFTGWPAGHPIYGAGGGATTLSAFGVAAATSGWLWGWPRPPMRFFFFNNLILFFLNVGFFL
jgi:hypothetical protein